MQDFLEYIILFFLVFIFFISGLYSFLDLFSRENRPAGH